MEEETLQDRLSRIQTLWTLVRQAHGGDDVQNAQQLLIERYGGAIRRYLLGALRDQDTADDLFQDFAYRFVHGDLRGADPGRGRFRDFLKGVLYHLIVDHHKKQKRRPGFLSPDHPEPAQAEPSQIDLDREFLTSWRDEILAKSWSALEEIEQKTGKPLYAVLRFRANNAKMPSAQMAEELGQQLGRAISAPNVRQILHRAREKFADLVLDEVMHSLEKPTTEQLQQELIDLGLMEYCRPALERRAEDRADD